MLTESRKAMIRKMCNLLEGPGIDRVKVKLTDAPEVYINMARERVYARVGKAVVLNKSCKGIGHARRMLFDALESEVPVNAV